MDLVVGSCDSLARFRTESLSSKVFVSQNSISRSGLIYRKSLASKTKLANVSGNGTLDDSVTFHSTLYNFTHDVTSGDAEGATDDEPKVPDGGYGWVIVAAATVMSFLATSMWGAFGVYYVAFVEHFRENKEYIPWIFSAQCLGYIVAGKSINSAL